MVGQVYLKMNKSAEALRFLVEAVKFKEAEYQTWYNLSGAYYLEGDTNSALSAIQKSLSLNSRNQAAVNFYNQLSTLIKNKK